MDELDLEGIRLFAVYALNCKEEMREKIISFLKRDESQKEVIRFLERLAPYKTIGSLAEKHSRSIFYPETIRAYWRKLGGEDLNLTHNYEILFRNKKPIDGLIIKTGKVETHQSHLMTKNLLPTFISEINNCLVLPVSVKEIKEGKVVITYTPLKIHQGKLVFSEKDIEKEAENFTGEKLNPKDWAIIHRGVITEKVPESEIVVLLNSLTQTLEKFNEPSK